jgi:choline dehydrogenase-like flavoprotein
VPNVDRPAAYDADYIVIGSGAGGGTLAARLAEAGFQVLLLEAGGDPRDSVGSTPQTPGVNSLPDDYDVPAFHPLSTENDGMRWDFFVQHYGDAARQALDPKHILTPDGEPAVLYPRAGTLGGCTAHNALILVYPHNADWNMLADLTQDRSWRAETMRGYFERLENCDYRADERALSRLGRNPSRHGWSGWLPTDVADPKAIVKDSAIRKTLVTSAQAVLRSPAFAHTDVDRASPLDELDPNDWRVVSDAAIGLRYTPLTTRNHRRVGSRERVLEVRRQRPSHLKIELHALATRVLFDASHRAIGVEYLSGPRLYGAHPRPSTAPGTRRRVFAAREVILAGGVFNTPQLLMLSGIGAGAMLTAHGIPVRVDLPGVGQNLQDRYEVAVVNRMTFPVWPSLEGATFTRNDRQYREWADDQRGVYTSNGAILSVVARSGPAAHSPDLFLYAVLSRFEGYFPGYSSLAAKHPNYLTWVILKGHTRNTAGEVTLHSADPRTPPRINFKYLDEGTAGHEEDLKALAAGVEMARRFAAPLRSGGLMAGEELPGDHVKDEDLAEFLRRNAWGHHASCTCRIGRREDGGVLSSDQGARRHGLRVVDASVFHASRGSSSAPLHDREKAADAAMPARAATGPVEPFGP